MTESELTDDELDAMEARAFGSLPGPWVSSIEDRDHDSGDDVILTGEDDGAPDLYITLSYRLSPASTPAPSNVLDFVAAARQDVPRLVAEVRRLRSVQAT